MKSVHPAFADSDDEDEVEKSHIRRPGLFASRDLTITEREQQKKAQEEDPSVYEYDEVLDDVVMSRKRSGRHITPEKKKPKYIENLLKKASERAHEKDIVMERQIQKERQSEGDMYRDKSKYVTSSYKKKMLEEEKWQEDQSKRDEEIEAHSVEKSGSYSSFYLNLLNKKSRRDGSVAGENGDHRALDQRRESVSPGKRDDESEQQRREIVLKRVANDLISQRPDVQDLVKSESVELVQEGIEIRPVQEEEHDTTKDLSSRFSRRSDEMTINSARERYLARKRQFNKR